jgi:hypothetical protein
MFGPKRDDMVGGSRNLQDEERHNLYSLQNIIRVIKSKRVRLAGKVVCMRVKRGIHLGFW